MRSGGVFRCHLRLFREQAGLRQEALAARVGISRQSLSSLEAGRSVPSTAVALRLGRVLERRVEDLFGLDEEPTTLVATGVGEIEPGARVALARLSDRWVAHALPAEPPEGAALAADAIVLGAATGSLRVEPLEPEAALSRHLFVAGCAPALGVLGGRLADGPSGVRLRWLHASSGHALDLLDRGLVHVAGAHLRDDATGEYNVPFVRRLEARHALRVVTLARWQAGILARPGGPRRVRSAQDLFRAGARVARREEGAGARHLLEALCRAHGRRRLPPGPAARSHAEVARLVAEGAADAGIGIASAARAWGLAFHSLAEERFDLVFRAELAADPRLQRLLEAVVTRAFRRELDALGGYDASAAGQLVAEVPAA
jgi:molybdate-binding protein/DNA-binding XRE family transcriptional regulator